MTIHVALQHNHVYGIKVNVIHMLTIIYLVTDAMLRETSLSYTVLSSFFFARVINIRYLKSI